MKPHVKIMSGILSLAFAFLASHANAKVNCNVIINSLPYVINSGHQTYCLGQNLTYNATLDTNILGQYTIFDPANNWTAFPNINFTAAIVVAAPNVILDLNNHTLTGTFLVPNRVAVGVYANDASNFKLQNGIIRGFDTGTYITSPNYALVNKITFDKTKLTAILSFAPQKNSVTNNTVTNFSSVNRWPLAPVAIMEINGASNNNDLITITNNSIAKSVGNSADPTPDDANLVWGTIGIRVGSGKGSVDVSSNILTNITAKNGVAAYLYFTNGSQITIRKNKFAFPVNSPMSSLQNIAVLQSGSKTTKADSNSFSGFHTQFYTFNTGTPLIFSNNVFNIYRINGNYPPLFYNYTKPSPVDAGGNIIIRN